MTIETPARPAPSSLPPDQEALFREARRVRRRRWTAGLLGAAIALGVVAAIVAIATSGSNAKTTENRAATAGALPNGPLARLNVAGPLAVAPHGTLYADDFPGAISGFEEHQQLLSIRNGQVTLLWQETNATPK